MTQPSDSGNHDDNPRLNAILAEYMKRKDAGQPIDQQTLLKAYPDLADGLQSYFEAESMMGGVGAAAVAETIQPRTPPQPTNVRETVRPGAAASDTASDFQIRSFGRYQLLRPVGEGAMGSVFLAQDSALDRQVALKIPKTDGKSSGDFLARFAREAKAAAGLKHPNICSVFDTGEHEGMPFITMEFIDGVPLSRFVGSSQLRSIDSILHMVATIADAVQHAHNKGVIHRDLKPGNILIDAELKPYVTDFGLARRVNSSNESRMTQEGLLIGTPAYMAPEQVKGEQAKVGPRSDVYSLGVMLFELLTSRLPFEGSVPEMLAQVLRDHPPSPSKFRKELTDDVDDLCVKMLRKDPEKRFASMTEVVAAVDVLRKKLKRAPVNQADVARQQSPHEIEKAHIEQMLTKGQYAAAIKDLEKLSRETLPGAKAAAEWACKVLPKVRAEAKALSPAGLTALLQTAQQLFQKHDYPGVIQLLEDVPSLRRTEAMEDLLEKAHAREAEAEQMLDEIKDRERSQNLDGIESLVKRFLKLKPGNSYAKRLWEALQSYSKTPASRRYYRFEKGRLQPMPEYSFLRQWALLASLLGVLAFLSVYYCTFKYMHRDTPISHGPFGDPEIIEKMIAVQIDGDWLAKNGRELTLVIDGKENQISRNNVNSDKFPISVPYGNHVFLVRQGTTVVNNPETLMLAADSGNVLMINRDGILLVSGPETPGLNITPETVKSPIVDPIPLPTPVPTPVDRKLVESRTVPNKEFGMLEKDLPEPEAVLVGFDVTEGIASDINVKVITSIKPLYRNNQGVLLESAKTYGVQHGTKKRLGDIPFYAVSAVEVIGAENFYVDSIDATFKPMDRFTDALPASVVKTARAGGFGGNSRSILGQNGKRSVGLLVRSSQFGITGLGLIQPSVAAVVSPPPKKIDAEPVPSITPVVTPTPKSLTPTEYARRGQARYARQEFADAIDDLRKSQAADVTNANTANTLGWYLSTVPDFNLRDGKRAVELANLACRGTEFKNCQYLDTLACAYAETRDFTNAVAWQKKAHALAPVNQKLDYESRLNRFLGERPMPDSSREPIVLIKRGVNGGHEWHYNHSRYSGTDWVDCPSNDDWPTGFSGFGYKPSYPGIVNTVWNKSDNEIYLRTKVKIKSLAGRVVVLDSQHDDSAKIYVNGTLAREFKSYGQVNSYVFAPDKQAYFKEGDNDIAVQCTQRGNTNSGNPQVIDIGLRLE